MGPRHLARSRRVRGAAGEADGWAARRAAARSGEPEPGAGAPGLSRKQLRGPPNLGEPVLSAENRAVDPVAVLYHDTLHNWVHPHNDAIILFLAERGYDALNLVEVRRRYGGEEIRGTLRVGDHEFAFG